MLVLKRDRRGPGIMRKPWKRFPRPGFYFKSLTTNPIEVVFR